MRQLTAKQKKILRQYDDCQWLEQLPNGVYQELEKINYTEILWQEVNRFLAYQYFNKKYK